MGSLGDLLTRSPVKASAPCRVDAGGTWDIKALALPLEQKTPATVNMALTLRTTVTLRPYEDRQVKISSRGFSRTETAFSDRLPFDSPFGLFFAAVSYFGVHGLEIEIDSHSPVKSALGGSSTALVALLGALREAATPRDRRTLGGEEILHLAYHLEDSISGGNCGIQDQAAAVYGGVHLWKWHFGQAAKPLTGISLLDGKDREALSNHILVAYSGKSHVAAQTNRKWVGDFLSGKTRSGWIKANESVHSFARAPSGGRLGTGGVFPSGGDGRKKGDHPGGPGLRDGKDGDVGGERRLRRAFCRRRRRRIRVGIGGNGKYQQAETQLARTAGTYRRGQDT